MESNIGRSFDRSRKKNRIVVTILGFVFAGVISSKRWTTSKQQQHFFPLNLNIFLMLLWSVFCVLLFCLVVIASLCVFFDRLFVFAHDNPPSFYCFRSIVLACSWFFLRCNWRHADNFTISLEFHGIHSRISIYIRFREIDTTISLTQRH